MNLTPNPLWSPPPSSLVHLSSNPLSATCRLLVAPPLMLAPSSAMDTHQSLKSQPPVLGLWRPSLLSLDLGWLRQINPPSWWYAIGKRAREIKEKERRIGTHLGGRVYARETLSHTFPGAPSPWGSSPHLATSSHRHDAASYLLASVCRLLTEPQAWSLLTPPGTIVHARASIRSPHKILPATNYVVEGGGGEGDGGASEWEKGMVKREGGRQWEIDSGRKRVWDGWVREWARVPSFSYSVGWYWLRWVGDHFWRWDS